LGLGRYADATAPSTGWSTSCRSEFYGIAQVLAFQARTMRVRMVERSYRQRDLGLTMIKVDYCSGACAASPLRRVALEDEAAAIANDDERAESCLRR